MVAASTAAAKPVSSQTAQQKHLETTFTLNEADLEGILEQQIVTQKVLLPHWDLVIYYCSLLTKIIEHTLE